MQFSSIFQLCQLKTPSFPWKTVRIYNPTTFGTYSAQLCTSGRDHLYLKLAQKHKQMYQMTLKTKVQPVFKLENALQPILSEVKLHGDSQYLAIRSQNGKELQQIYNILKKLVAHKGFSDYFKPIRRLGKGAFATVYLIEHKFTKRQFAAKVFSRQGQKLESKGKQALQNEIRMLRFLSHPNIIKYQGLYQTQNLIYLVTQYLSGGTLQECMKDKCNLTEEVISHVLINSLNALAYLEKNHIMHRDIKPENILLRPQDKNWVIIDFGLSAFSNQNYLYNQCGTMGYIAPQIMQKSGLQNQQNKAYNSVCDMYSLGIIAYQMIIGTLPFKVQIQGIFQKKLVWNGFKNEEFLLLPEQLKSFIKGVLENNPKLRITAQAALKSSIFSSDIVKQLWGAFGKRKREERYAKILKMANIN